MRMLLLSITSTTLIFRLTKGFIFHIDGTYKIIKYSYTIIIFGFSKNNGFQVTFLTGKFTTLNPVLQQQIIL